MLRIVKHIILLIPIFLFGSRSLFAQLGFGSSEKINGDWQFHLGDLDITKINTLSSSAWRSVQLPYDWSVKYPLSPNLASATGYLPGGIGWYQKKMIIPIADQGKKLYLYFEGVYNRSEVFVNGKSVGKRPYGYISFSYDVSSLVEYGKENTIAVKVDHSHSADSRWYTGSGIYRDVWIVKANPVHLEQWGVYAYPAVKGNQGNLHVEVALVNETSAATAVELVQELIDESGNTVGKIVKKTTISPNGRISVPVKITVKNPKLWSLEQANRYKLKTVVLHHGKEIDRSEVKTGFRTLAFDPDQGFALNGKWTKVKGVCIHHDAGVLGAKFYPEVWRRRLLTLKSLGVNAIRTSHNPQATSLYDLCDELGLLVMNEAYDEWEYPKRKWIAGWNVGTAGFEGAYDFFADWGERDLADMVKRDRNHISIFAWSIGNEVDYPNDPYSHPILDGSQGNGFTQPIFGGYKKDAPDAMRLGDIAKRLAAVVKKYDTSRPVTAGLAGVAMSNETEYPGVLDIAGYNYTESRYQEDHKRYPKRVIFGSENRHDLAAWKAVQENNHIFGQFLWTGIDYLGESGLWPSRGFYSGLLDFAGLIKPRGYFRQALWSEKPMAYLGTYALKGEVGKTDVWSDLEAERGQRKNEAPSMDAWPIWNYREGQLIRVVCYTNTAFARLELNGKVVGDIKSYNEEQGIVYWDIPYAEGRLEVIGFDKEQKELVRQVLETSGRSHALAIISESSVSARTGDVIQVELQVVDKNNRPVVLADDEVTCRIVGAARLLGLEAGNNSDMTDYTDNRHRVYHGKMIAYIQLNPGQGNVSVQFSAPWLENTSMLIQRKENR
ncbi:MULTISPECIES: sugar-binding domain-containing protein [Sphingobacterium]|uniref:sugar-binding domain-containing protein n=2 Tax=Sphingobacteriaceae TaxID=84566 RepID=UPI00104EDDD1|nr:MULTISPECIES: sugar-binding domain-containing protein [Sphingobacterium]MCW2263844.1 hypothetical protein [Sphingobacterium kitahiroshimense]TCR00358.1 uncharacterized protein DUF4982 [Sphingobacterium sp. JUb78]